MMALVCCPIFSVSRGTNQTPKYRLRSVLCAADTAEIDATAWQRAFSEAGHRLKRFVF
jgi:hypothetical protein